MCSHPASPREASVTPASPASPAGAPPSEHTVTGSQAPEDIPVSGFTHGAQRSSSAQSALGSSAWLRPTSGMHTLMQRPSAPPIDAHLRGVYEVPPRMIASGTQLPPVPHCPKSRVSCDGTNEDGTHRALPSVQHDGSVAGSTRGSIGQPLAPPPPPLPPPLPPPVTGGTVAASIASGGASSCDASGSAASLAGRGAHPHDPRARASAMATARKAMGSR